MPEDSVASAVNFKSNGDGSEKLSGDAGVVQAVAVTFESVGDGGKELSGDAGAVQAVPITFESVGDNSMEMEVVRASIGRVHVPEEGVAAAVNFKSAGEGGGEKLTIGDARVVQFGGLGPTGIAGRRGHRAEVPFGSGGGSTTGLASSPDGAFHTVTGAGSPPSFSRPPLGAEHVDGGADPAHALAPAGGGADSTPVFFAPAGGGADSTPAFFAPVRGGADPTHAFAPAGGGDLRWHREGNPLVGGVVARDMPANFRLIPAGGDLWLGGMTRPQAAVLAMIIGATTILGEPDAPWPRQLWALLAWLVGCVALFLSTRN